MAVRLAWTVRTQADEQRVYRSTSPLDQSSLPAALATIGAADREYTDSTSAVGATYWYGVASVATGPAPDVVLITQARIVTRPPGGYIKDGAGNQISDGAGNQITWAPSMGYITDGAGNSISDGAGNQITWG